MKANTIKTVAKLIDWQFDGVNYDIEKLDELVALLKDFVLVSLDVANEHRGSIPEDEILNMAMVAMQAGKLIDMIGE